MRARKSNALVGAFSVLCVIGPIRAQGQLVISQIFGASGGNAAAANGDFVEIFNRSCIPVPLSQYRVQVTNNNASPTWSSVTLPNLALDPGQYFCIRLNTTATGTAYTADLNTTVGDVLQASGGKAAIVLATTSIPTGTACPAQSAVVDFVMYAATAGLCTESNRFFPSSAATGGRGYQRKLNGCQDTNNNFNDFVSDTTPAIPRTLASGASPCFPQVVYGACDLDDGSCRATPNAAACTALGGAYQGDCVQCTFPEACCMPTSPTTCTLVTPAQCVLDGGLNSPGQLSCPPTPACPSVGRCCAPDGTCTLTFSAFCESPNVFGGAGSNCNGTPCEGACCGIDGSCNSTSQIGCIAPSVFGGIGTNCATVQCSGRCCDAGGNCTITGVGQCAGTFTIGLTCDPVDILTFDNIGLVIPESPGGPVSDTQVVAGVASPITDLDVDIKIDHSYIGDLVINIEHLGVNVQLYTGVPVGGGCFTGKNPDLILDDEGIGGAIMSVPCPEPAADPLAPQSPPSYTPANPLNAFDGLDPNGDWTLSIRDDQGADTGTLIRWSLHIGHPGQACSVVGCTCYGDVTGDGLVNGKDIRFFTNCLVSGAGSCSCADMNHSGSTTTADLSGFITAVMSGSCGP